MDRTLKRRGLPTAKLCYFLLALPQASPRGPPGQTVPALHCSHIRGLQVPQAPGPGCHLSGPGRRGLRAGMSLSGNVYLPLPSQGQARTVRRLRTVEGPPAITLRGTFEPAGWRTHPMASPGGTFFEPEPRLHLDPRPGGTVCDQGPPVGVHLAGPAPSATRIAVPVCLLSVAQGGVCPA